MCKYKVYSPLISFIEKKKKSGISARSDFVDNTEFELKLQRNIFKIKEKILKFQIFQIILIFHKKSEISEFVKIL